MKKIIRCRTPRGTQIIYEIDDYGEILNEYERSVSRINRVETTVFLPIGDDDHAEENDRETA